jgi:hypothetical protein
MAEMYVCVGAMRAIDGLRRVVAPAAGRTTALRQR